MKKKSKRQFLMGVISLFLASAAGAATGACGGPLLLSPGTGSSHVTGAIGAPEAAVGWLRAVDDGCAKVGAARRRKAESRRIRALMPVIDVRTTGVVRSKAGLKPCSI